ncbi:protein asteroid homolog 1-like [Lampris incognitus]|uniref:protein asteroid homolog 1-like n=1 Tax=Lampris incognitus TaxID=2546036 RepID=UPI0024B5CAD4|nr:protein asteroid homolog 1-like [Lampris incognitus]
MGIQCLTQLAESHPILETFTLKKRKIVIDGSSLYRFLYFKVNLDGSHGGDYIGFKDVTCQFFQALEACEIEAYVLLDGGADRDDKKIPTQICRLEYKVEKVSRIVNRRAEERDGVLPPLIKDVFKQIMRERNVAFAQCFGEADPEVVSLANKWQCPVVSHDSNFYIYDLSLGLLPLLHFDWQGKKDNEIKAKRYRASIFCDHFEINSVLLPVFASIAGNDYSRLEDRGWFLRKYPGDRSKTWQLDRLRAILWFLSGTLATQEAQVQNQQQAVNFVLKETGHYTAEKCHELIYSSDLYSKVPACTIDSFFDDNGNPPVKPEYLNVLPDWMVLPLMQGRQTSFFIDVLRLQRMYLGSQVENINLHSSHSASGQIRQYLYWLLVREQGFVTEYDRKPGELKVEEKRVSPIRPNALKEDNLPLNRLNQAPQETCLAVLVEALHVPFPNPDLNNIPNDLKLPVCVIHFWKKNCMDISNCYVDALLLGAVYGERLKQSDDGIFQRKMTKKRKMAETEERLDLAVAHAYSQWQSRLKDSLQLNQLLGSPLPEPGISWYGITRCLLLCMMQLVFEQ